MDYMNHLPQGLEHAAINLYLTALRDKLVPIFGEDHRAQQVLAKKLNTANCMAALHDGELVGILGIQTIYGGFLNPSYETMLDAYGVFSGLFRMAGLVLLHHETAPDEFYIDGIAVRESMRGKRIGSHLLRMLEKRAVSEGIRTITLEVINTNPRAEALYRRHGFFPAKRRSLRPFNRLMGFPFHSATLMKKTVTPGSG